MKPQESSRPATTSGPADTLVADLEQKIALKRAGRLASTPDRWKGQHPQHGADYRDLQTHRLPAR